MGSRHGEVRELLQQAQDQGFVVKPTRSGHVRVMGPEGGLVVMSSTPSDPRALLNARSQLRRLGLQDRKKRMPRPVVASATVYTGQAEAAPPPPAPKSPPWAHWSLAQVRDLHRQGYSAGFVRARTGR